MLDVRRLRLLREFAVQGSIAATATALGYTPSAVSQQLAALERDVGTPLLDRTARSAELTDAGQRLVEHAERILTLIEEAESDLSARSAEPTGRVVVTAFPTAAVAFAPALAEGLRRHSGLTLRLRQTRAGDGLQRVRAGAADIALVDDWTGLLPEREKGSSLSFRHLLRERLVLVVPRGHPVPEHDARVDLREMRERPWLAAPTGEPSRNAVDELLGKAGGAPPVPWEFEGLGTIVSLVAQGVGISAVPCLALTTGIQGIDVRELPDSPTRYVWAVARTSSLRRPSVAVTLEAIASVAAEITADGRNGRGDSGTRDGGGDGETRTGEAGNGGGGGRDGERRDADDRAGDGGETATRGRVGPARMPPHRLG
jgi:DNA-binding transcriptional LysR family regulator